MSTEAQAEGTDVYAEAFNRGFEAATRLFGVYAKLEDVEAVKKLPAGSVVKDSRGRLQFRTTANGWISIAGARTSSMYLALPVEVMYHS